MTTATKESHIKAWLLLLYEPEDSYVAYFPDLQFLSADSAKCLQSDKYIYELFSFTLINYLTKRHYTALLVFACEFKYKKNHVKHTAFMQV